MLIGLPGLRTHRCISECEAVLLDVIHSHKCNVHYHEILNKMPLFLGITLSLCCLVTVFYSVSNSHLQLEAEILRREKLLWKSFTAYPNPSKMRGLSTYLTLCHPSFLSSVVSVSAFLFFFFPNSKCLPISPARILLHLPTSLACLQS